MDDFTFEPIRIDTTKPALDDERFDLFFIDDKAYTAPKVVPAGVALRALQIVATQGVMAGAWHMVMECLGEDAIEALMECKQLEHSQLKKMLNKVSDVYYGQLEDLTAKGK